MEAGSIFLVLALAVLVAIFVGRPLLSRAFARPRVEVIAEDSLEHRRSALLAEHDRLLATLQELDFDQALGKIPAEDYPVQRGALMRRAAEVLRELDQIHGQASAVDAEDRIEQAIAARRADSARAAAPSSTPAAPAALAEDDLEALIASRRKQRLEKSAGFCPKCGRPAQKSDRFCSGCGAVLG